MTEQRTFTKSYSLRKIDNSLDKTILKSIQTKTSLTFSSYVAFNFLFGFDFFNLQSNPDNADNFVPNIFRPDAEYLDKRLIRIFFKNLHFCQIAKNERNMKLKKATFEFSFVYFRWYFTDSFVPFTREIFCNRIILSFTFFPANIYLFKVNK